MPMTCPHADAMTNTPMADSDKIPKPTESGFELVLYQKWDRFLKAHGLGDLDGLEAQKPHSDVNKQVTNLLNKLRAETYDDIESTLRYNNEVKKILFGSLTDVEKITLKNLIWIESMEETLKLLNEDRQVRKSYLREVMIQAINHFHDFMKYESDEHGELIENWKKTLKSMPWYIDPSLLNPLNATRQGGAVVNLLATQMREQRFQDDSYDCLFEWVQCLHEKKKAPLFCDDLSTRTQSLKSVTDGAGNTALMLAVKSGSLRTFSYIFKHTASCSVSSCTCIKKVPELQLDLLNETNAFKENALHLMCKLLDLDVMQKMLTEIDSLVMQNVKASEVQLYNKRDMLMRSRDFLGKNMLHHFFGKSLDTCKHCDRDLDSHETKILADKETAPADKETAPADKETAPADKETAPADKETALGWEPKTPKQAELIMNLVKPWIVIKPQVVENAIEDMLTEEDSAGYNVLLTAVKNRNVASVDLLKMLGRQEKLKKLLNSKNGMDLACVLAAFANLKDQKKIEEKLSVQAPSQRDERQDTAKTEPQKVDIQEKLTFGFGGPIKWHPSEADKNKADSKGDNTEFSGWTPMHFACRYGNMNNIRTLLDDGYRTDERTADGRTAGSLAFEAEHEEELKKSLQEKYLKNRCWLAKYVSSVDPVSSAFEQVSQVDAHRSLKARDPEIRSELQYVTDHIHLFNESESEHETRKGHKRMRHYLHCLNSRESVESYLYLCLQLDSAELYRCLINSAYWKKAVNTRSIEEIEDSTVRYIIGKRDFEEMIDEKTATTYKQATTVAVKLEKEDYVKLTIQEDHDNQVDCCNCCVLPQCCTKCCRQCGCLVDEEHDDERSIFKYMKNGVIFLSYGRQRTTVLEQYNLIGLALLTGRIQMVKCLLMTRQYDLIPASLQVIIQTDNLISCDGSKTNSYLLEVKEFATHVLLNAVNTLYSGSNERQREVIFQYILGQLSGGSNTEINLSLKGHGHEKSDVDKYYSGAYYPPPNESDAPLLAADRDKKIVDFYTRKPKYWPDDASLICETSSTGPFFQHHLKSGVEFKLSDDRRAMKCLILERNTMPMYNILELAKKSGVKILFSTNCFQDLSEMLWRQPVAAVAAPSDKHGCSSGVRCDCRKMFCPLGMYITHLLSYLFYLAVFMRYVISDGYKFGWEQVIVTIYIASFFVQELYEAFDQINAIGHGITSYLKSVWNIYDWLLIVFTTAGIATVARIGVDLGRLELPTESDKAAFLNSGNTLMNVYNSKMTLGFGFVFSAVKLLSILRFFEATGASLAIMPYIFLRDLLPFAAILTVMIVAFGTYFYTMLFVGGFQFYSNFTYQEDREKLTLVEVYTRPLLAVFGNFDLDNLRRCKEKRLNGESAQGCVLEQGANVFIYVGLFIFILIVNLVMVNMLIAKFSATVENMNKRSKIDWMYNKFEMLLEYKTTSILPPPFNLLYYGPLAIHYLRRTAEQSTHKNGNDDPVPVSENPFETFFVIQAQKFGGNRKYLYANPVLVFKDEDIEEGDSASDVKIDFKKLGYLEDEANEGSERLRVYTEATASRLNITKSRPVTARPQTPVRPR